MWWDNGGMVPDDTVHLSEIGTQVSLILDIFIASYSTSRFFYSFFLFYTTGKTAVGDKLEGTVSSPNFR